ncbi:MAG: TetR/AcrR family transcriptional regulator [Planctomycetota bacterium]|nr:TetR/AcrR family transcriptional regulator [Planctomycetota bacterium]
MSPRKADPKLRPTIIESALELMLDGGYNGTSVNDICEAAGVSKGAFFHYFKDKEALALTVLETWCKGAQRALDSVDFESLPPLQRALAMVDAVTGLMQSSPKQSCLLGIFSQELSGSHPKLRDSCRDAFQNWVDMLGEFLDGAARQFKLANIDTDALARQFIVVFQGSMVVAKAYQDRQLIGEQAMLYKAQLEMIFKSE